MALKSASSIYSELMKSQDDVIVTSMQASLIWSMFRPKALSAKHFQSIEHRAFMQACLMSAIEASEAMSWVETLFRSSMKPTASIKSLIRGLVKHSLQKYYNQAVGNPDEIYRNVVSTISWSHKSYFEDIEQGLGVMF